MEMEFELNGIETAAKRFLEAMKDYNVFAFHGNLGAGKTTFIRAICLELGVTDHVTSPTFGIINNYQTSRGIIIYHIDLYRVKNIAEAVDAGVEDCLYSGGICFVEWPGKFFNLLPIDTVQVYLEVTGEFQRRLEIKFP
jgi:tRNA threonylcarbamoyladenosine biosynthesis protein TsaE